MLINSLLSFVLAAVFCLLLTPAFRRLGMKMGVYSTPGDRRVNSSPIPRLGGASIFISFLLTLLVIFYAKDFFYRDLPQIAKQSLLLPLFLGGACAWLLGLLDDIRHIRARYKLLIQIAVAVGAYLLGLQVHAIHIPILGILNLGDYSWLFTVLWIVGTINAVNFIDGIDGLCSGIALCAFLGILYLATFSGVDTGVIVCCALIGCTLAFLIFNFQPASIFLGDSGAYFLGFMLAALPVFIAAKGPLPGVFHISFIIFLIVPFLDTSLAVLRRLILGVPISAPDRGHLHHRLLDGGYTQKRVTATISFISLAFVIAGVIVVSGNRWQIMPVLVISAGAVYLLLRLCDINSLKDLKPAHVSNISKAVLMRRYAPAFLHDMVCAGDWPHAQKILDEFSRNTKMHTVTITCQKNGNHNVVWNWRAEQDTLSRRRPQLCKTYEVSRDNAFYQFYFCWDSEYSNVRKDMDALLEVISETIGKSCHEKFFS